MKKSQSQSNTCDKKHGISGTANAKNANNNALQHFLKPIGTQSGLTSLNTLNNVNNTPHKSQNKANYRPEIMEWVSKNRNLDYQTQSGDRLIPNRTATDLESAQFAIYQQERRAADDAFSEALSGGGGGGGASRALSIECLRRKEHERRISEALQLPLPGQQNILKYGRSKPVNDENNPANAARYHEFEPDIVTSGLAKANKRVIVNKPERVLDAPNLRDDFYENPMDWGIHGHLATALGESIYSWNSNTKAVMLAANLHDTYPDETLRACALKWVGTDSGKVSNLLMIATNKGQLLMYDVNNRVQLREFISTGNAGGGGGGESVQPDTALLSHSRSRITSIAIKDYVVTTGNAFGQLCHYDLRQKHALIGYSSDKEGVVPGLAYSPNKTHLASGHDTNVAYVWDARTLNQVNPPPLLSLTQHVSAIKALAWCPWKPSHLATGGGTNDKTIKLWNVSTGACQRSVATQSQVTGLVFNEEYRELVSSHGHPHNSLALWSQPEWLQLGGVPAAHSSRIISIVPGPNRQMLASCGSDQLIKIWNLFPVDMEKKKREAQIRADQGLLIARDPR